MPLRTRPCGTPLGWAAMEAPFLRGLAIYRWVAWVWIAAMTYAGRDNLGRPVLAWAFVAAALAVTAWLTVLLQRDPDSLLAPLPVTVELICGASLIFFDGVVYEPGHAFATVAVARRGLAHRGGSHGRNRVGPVGRSTVRERHGPRTFRCGHRERHSAL